MLITVEHVTVVLVMPGQKKLLAIKSCAIQRSGGCAVSGAVPVQVSCFNTHGWTSEAEGLALKCFMLLYKICFRGKRKIESAFMPAFDFSVCHSVCPGYGLQQ